MGTHVSLRGDDVRRPPSGAGQGWGARMTRFAVVVLGMHESGTSVLAELLARSGLALPRTTMPSHADNPSGRLESEQISAFNKRLLESAGTPWHDWSHIPCQWFLDPRRQVDVAAAASIVRDEYGDAPAIVIKDPCMCRLLPLWRQVFGALGIDWSAALIVRHAAEVARSMAARPLDPTSQGTYITNGSQCALLWLRHNLEAESQTRDVPRSVVSHAELMSSPHGAMVRLWRDLGVRERVSAPADWPELVKAVRVEHYRHRQSPREGADAALPRPCAQWLDRMLERVMAAGQPECGARTKTELDSARAGLDHACDLYGTARSVEDRAGPDDRVAHAILRSLAADAEDPARASRNAVTGMLLGRWDRPVVLNASDECAGGASQDVSDIQLMEGGDATVLARETQRDRLHVQALYPVHATRAVRSSASWRLMAPLRVLGWIVRSTPWRRASAMREIRESGLFDAAHYVTSHPGQVPQGCDPLRHFFEIGGSAGLSPSPRFDCEHYLATNPDVRASGINPLLHYLRTGRREGRRALPDDVGTETGDSTPTEGADSLRCHVDHLQCNEYGLYVHGWIHAEPLPLRGQIDVTTRSGQTESSALAVGLLREDVARAHPGWVSAGRAGFMALSGAPGSPIVRALLTFWRPDGSADEVLLIDAARAIPQVRRRSWTTLARTALSLVRSGKLEQLHVRLRNLRSQRRLAGARGDLERAVHSPKEERALLVIDHGMGGGANVARRRTVEEWVGRGGTAFVLTFLVHDMQFMLELHRSGAGCTDFAVGGLDHVRQALRHARIDEVLYNCAVSLPNATEVAQLIADVVSDHGARLRVEMHDYFPVCPSPVLLDAERRHCGVPSLDVCRACLKANHDPYVSLAGERSIDAWRKRWGALLAMASEIRCFSDASARVVLRAYPGVQAKITVVPHEVTGMRPVRVRRSPSDELVVGVIGAIGFHKGSTVVGDLVRAMERDPQRSRVVVIGTLESDCSSARLVQTGSYRHEQLPALVERHGINVGLVPSVWPETFCFVAHEVAAMGLPLVTLDYGAQADLARNYPRGRVSASQDGERLLQTLWDAASA